MAITDLGGIPSRRGRSSATVVAIYPLMPTRCQNIFSLLNAILGHKIVSHPGRGNHQSKTHHPWIRCYMSLTPRATRAARPPFSQSSSATVSSSSSYRHRDGDYDKHRFRCAKHVSRFNYAMVNHVECLMQLILG